MDLAVQAPPFGRVLVLGLDVLKGDREVHEVEVEVVDAPELELVAGDLLGLRIHQIHVIPQAFYDAYAGLFVEGVPELGGDN